MNSYLSRVEIGDCIWTIYDEWVGVDICTDCIVKAKSVVYSLNGKNHSLHRDHTI